MVLVGIRYLQPCVLVAFLNLASMVGVRPQSPFLPFLSYPCISDIAVFGFPTGRPTCLGIKFFGKTFSSVLYRSAFSIDFWHLILPWKVLGLILIIATVQVNQTFSLPEYFCDFFILLNYFARIYPIYRFILSDFV